MQHYNDPGVDSEDREEPNLQILDTIELGTSSHSVSGCQVELETKVRFAKISQSQRRPLLLLLVESAY